MGLYQFDVEDTFGSAWLLESFQRRFSETSDYEEGFQFGGSPYLTSSDCDDEGYYSYEDEYLKNLFRCITEPNQFHTREINQEPSLIVSLPTVQTKLLRIVPQKVIDLYWEINRSSEKSKLLTLPPMAEWEELLPWEDSWSPLSSPVHMTTDASRKSRTKKRLTTELLLDCHEADTMDSILLEEDEHQLQLIIAVLEDKIVALTGNPRLIDFYRDLSCLF